MGPHATMQMGGYLREQILKNAEVFFRPLLAETKKERIGGGDVKLKTKDLESKIEIFVDPTQSTAVLTYPIDTDDKSGNGRIYVEDRFVFDPATKTLIGDPQRSFRLGDGAAGSAPWGSLFGRLKELEKSAPLKKEDPKVLKFFNDVVLQIPAPSGVEDDDGGKTPQASAPPPSPQQPPVPSSLGSLSSLAAVTPAKTVEEAHLRRLAVALSVTGGPWGGDVKGMNLLRRGLAELASTGFTKEGPAAFTVLLESSENHPDQKAFAQTLIALSKGQVNRAHLLLLGVSDRAPSADFLLRWLGEYEQASKNLKLLGTLRLAAEESYGKEVQEQGAWISKAASLVTKKGDKVRRESEIVKILFDRFETKIRSGEATTVDQAFAQVEGTGSEEEKAVLKKIQESSFAGGVLTDLRRVSGLKGNLLDRAVLTVGHEKLLSQRLSAAQSAFAFTAESGDRTLAASGRDGVALLSGEGRPRDQVDRMVGHFADELASPMVVSSLLIGSSAFHMAENAALVRFGGMGVRSSILSTGLGLAAEAPAFELAHRGLNAAFTGAPNERSFLKGTAANYLTFGALRFTGLGAKIAVENIPEASLPFGRATMPIVSHGASFGSLHAVNEFERAVHLRPKEGPYTLRLMEDGAFYVQMGLAGKLAHDLAGPGFSASVQDLQRAHEWAGRFGALHVIRPKGDAPNLDAKTESTKPAVETAADANDGRVLTDNDPTPVNTVPELRPSGPDSSRPPAPDAADSVPPRPSSRPSGDDFIDGTFVESLPPDAPGSSNPPPSSSPRVPSVPPPGALPMDGTLPEIPDSPRPPSTPPPSSPRDSSPAAAPSLPRTELTAENVPDGQPSQPPVDLMADLLPPSRESQPSLLDEGRPTSFEVDKEVIQAAAKIADLTVQLGDAKSRVAELEAELQKKQDSKPPRSGEVDQELRELRVERDRLTTQLALAKAKAEQADAAQARVEELARELVRVESEKVGIEGQRDSAAQKAADFEEQLSLKTEELAAAVQQRTTDLDALRAEATRIVDQWREAARQAGEARLSAESALEVKNQEVEAKNREVEAAQAVAERARQEVARISQSRTEAIDENIALETRLRRQLADAEQKAREAALALKPLEAARDAAQRLAVEKTAEAATLGERVTTVEAQLGEITILKQALGEAAGERDHAQAMLRVAKGDVERAGRLRQEAAQVQRKFHDDYLRAIGDLRTEVSGQKDRIQALEQENNFLTGDRDQEKLRADTEHNRAEGLQQKVSELETQAGDLKKELDRDREKLEMAGRRLRAFETALNSEKERVERRQTEVDRLKNLNSEIGDTIKGKEARIRELLQEIKELNEMEDVTADAVSDEETQLQEQIQTLEAEKAAEQRQAQKNKALVEVREKEILGLRTRVEGLEGQAERARAELDRKRAEHNELALAHGTLNNEVDGLRREVAQKAKLEERLALQQEENARLRRKLEEEQAKVARAVERLTQLSQQLAEAQGLNEQFAKKMGEVLTQLQTAKQDFEEKKQELRQANAELVQLRTDQRSNAAVIDHLSRREGILVERVNKLEADLGEAQTHFETKKREAAQLRTEKGQVDQQVATLEREKREADRNLLRLNGQVQGLERQVAALNLDVSLLRPEAQKKGEALAEATRTKELLRGKERELAAAVRREAGLSTRLEEARASATELRDLFAKRDREATAAETKNQELELELSQLRPKLEEAIQNATTAGQQVEVLREVQEELRTRISALETERDEAKTEVDRLRLVEAEQASRIRELSGDPLKKRRETPAYSSRMLDGPPEDMGRRRHTPPLAPQPDQVANDLRLARLELGETQRRLTEAEEKARAAEEARLTAVTEAETFGKEIERLKAEQNGWGDKAKALRGQVTELQKALGDRGPAYFGNQDPRVLKVDYAIQGFKPLTHKNGQIVGRAQIIAGGKEGSIPTIQAPDGALISAKTTIGVPKKSQKVNEDSVYVCQFTIPDNNGGKTLTVLAGADGAGGENRGDLATVWLQGIHARVAEAAHEGRVPEAAELLQAGREAVDAQHDLYGIPRYDVKEDGSIKPIQVTGAGAVVVIVGNQAMIATVADAHVVLSRRQADGSYQTVGYSNADLIPHGNVITNGIDLRAVKAVESDGLEPDAKKIEYALRRPPKLYQVKDLRPGDRFTIGSDGFWNHIHPIFVDEINFPGSQEWQLARGLRPYMLHEHFKLLNLMLEASAGQSDAAVHFHDWAFQNMKQPGLVYSFGGRDIPLPTKTPNNDNIFVISYEHGEHKNGGIRIPSEYGPMEPVLDAPAPPLMEYKPAIDGDYTRIIGQYLDALKTLYGPQVGEQVARDLARLYRNIPTLEAKFNPALMVNAKDAKGMNDLFDAMKREVEAHPEMQMGDNRRFMETAREDVKKVQDAAYPFQKASQPEAGAVYGKYTAGLREVFGAQSGVAAQHFADLYHNFGKLPEYASTWSLKRSSSYTIGRDGPYEGREGPCDILLDQTDVAPLHAQVYEQNGKWYLKDMGSPFGTFFNGQRVNTGQEDLELPSSGTHQIRLGGSKSLTFRVAEDGTRSLRLDQNGLEENFNPGLMARLSDDSRGKMIKRIYSAFHTDKSLPTEVDRTRSAFDAVKGIKDLATGPRSFFVNVGGAPRPESAPPPQPQVPTWDLEAGQSYVVGRNGEAQIRVDDKSVSKLHARIYSENGKWYVVDLQSSNGTVVNGKKLKPNQALELNGHRLSVIKVGLREFYLQPQQGGKAVFAEVVGQDANPETRRAQPGSEPPPATAGAADPQAAGQGQRFKFEIGPNKNYVMGSALISDPTLSKMHAGFLHNGEVWLVRDLGSTNGTWLEKQEIHKPQDWNKEKREMGNWHEIRHGNILTMGQVYVRLTLDAKGNLELERISPWQTGWAPAGAADNNAGSQPPPANWQALPPQYDSTHFKMNGSNQLQIVKGTDHPDIYRDNKTKGVHYWIIEQTGAVGKLLNSKTVYAIIMRMQNQYLIQSQVEDMRITRGQESVEVPKGRQFNLMAGDTVSFGKFTRTFLPY